MLRAYFDDSGTHANSEFVVWGGVAGTEADFEKLDVAWSSKLKEPLPGKPPLKKFSLSNCALSVGEFESYKPAERDALRYDMRQIIAESGVRPRAYAVPVRAYNRIIRGRVRKAYGAPDGIAFSACASWAMGVAEINNMPLTCVFDKGQSRPWLDFLLNDADERAAVKGVDISYGYSAVADVCGLQAADTIATEHYWYALACARSHPPVITPHMASLIETTNPSAYVFLENDMETLRREYLKIFPLRDWLLHRNRDTKLMPWPSGE